MFHNHASAFARFDPAITAPADLTPRLTLSGQTRVETAQGWVAARTLRAGDVLATLDGGFAPITAISTPDISGPMIHVPGGTLSACSDLILPGEAHVALMPSPRLSEAPIVSVPLRALCGWRGIRPTLFGAAELATLHFETEELIFAQTGVMIHAAPADSPFFPMLSYGDTRALLALMDERFGRPDTAAA